MSPSRTVGERRARVGSSLMIMIYMGGSEANRGSTARKSWMPYP
jgi:hypothetical protein